MLFFKDNLIKTHESSIQMIREFSRHNSRPGYSFLKARRGAYGKCAVGGSGNRLPRRAVGDGIQKLKLHLKQKLLKDIYGNNKGFN